MNIKTRNHNDAAKGNIRNQTNLMSSPETGAKELEENRVMNINLIRAREGSRIRRTNIDWFSL